MTGAARRDVLSVRLCLRRVTTETRHMSIQARRNRESHAIAIFSMSSRTSCRRVFCVIELGVEAAQRREGFDLSTLNVRVTNRANLTRWI